MIGGRFFDKKRARSTAVYRNGWHFVPKNGSIIEALGKSENASSQKCLGEGDDISFQEGYHLCHFVGLLWNLGDGIYIFYK